MDSKCRVHFYTTRYLDVDILRSWSWVLQLLRRIRSCGTYTQFLWCFQFLRRIRSCALHTTPYLYFKYVYLFFEWFSGSRNFDDPGLVPVLGLRGSKFGVWGSGNFENYKVDVLSVFGEHETWKLLRNVRHEINFETEGTLKESMQWKTKCLKHLQIKISSSLFWPERIKMKRVTVHEVLMIELVLFAKLQSERPFNC